MVHVTHFPNLHGNKDEAETVETVGVLIGVDDGHYIVAIDGVNVSYQKRRTILRAVGTPVTPRSTYAS
jgi:hypothetical protein